MKAVPWIIAISGTGLVIISFFIGWGLAPRTNYAYVPAYTGAAFQFGSDGQMTAVKDTNDLNAVQGMQGPYLHHVYKLDSVTFDAYYFASGWTAYAKSGGYLKDTTLFVNYQRKPVCVSVAVQALIVAKYLPRAGR